MAVIKKYADVLTQNLTLFQTYITDTAPNSKYFKITEFKDTFTGGKNGFLIEGSEHLKESTEIKIQILDVNGDPIYYEPGNGVPEYYEGTSKLVAVYIYEDTPIGSAKITILGELKTYVDDNGIVQQIPDEWKNVYNLKWEKDFQVNRLLSNEDKVRFYRRPVVNIEEIVKPIYSNVVATKTQKGYIDGISQAPIQGQPLVNYTSPASYLLQIIDDTNWTGSVVDTYLQTDLGYSPLVTELVNNKELIVQTPYTSNGLVANFSNVGYTASFNYTEGVDNLKTALTGSFAKIELTDLTTFVGDCARVKIFRKSQSDLSDYQFVQEIKLESNELLVDLESTLKNQEYYGIFDGNNHKEYWITSSNSLTTEFNQTYLFDSIKLDGSAVSSTYFYTSKSLLLTEGIEYSLQFDSRIQQNISQNYFIRAFISGSRTTNINGNATIVQVEQDIIKINSSNALLQKQIKIQNFTSEEIDNAKLYFEVIGSGWYIANISLTAAQETAYSPDEITFIQSVPRSLPIETFDYRFEFYDINNNYIPVLVEASKTFDGGNLQTIRKQLRLIPSATGFQFDSGSNPVPPTVITVEIEKTLLTGSVTFTSQSYDFFGNALSGSDYTASWTGQQYPGRLDNITGATPFLTVANFTGSRTDINVQLVTITGECEGYTDTINIYKILDGFGGVNHIIRPYRGTQIRNSSTASLEIQAVRIDGINDILLNAGAQKNFGNIQLHVISKSLEGIEKFVNLAYVTQSNMFEGLTTGSIGTQEINYNATFTRDSIDFRRIIYLMPSSSAAGKFAYEASSSVLASIVLEDLQDGLDSGKVVFNADSFTINPRLDIEFKPVFAFATASFAKRATAGENEYITSSFQVYPSMSINKDYVPEYWMYYHTQSLDPTLTVTAIDDNKLVIPSQVPSNSNVRSPLQQTKNLTLTFTYTEPWTSASVSFDKTFTIIPEGKPGDETIIFEINPISVNLKANSRGDVTSYDQSATQIRLKQGSRYLKFNKTRTAGTFYTASRSINSDFWITGSNIMTGSWIDNVPLGSAYDEYLLVGNASKFNDLSGSILYNLEIQPYYTSSVYTSSITQNYTKTLDGPEPIQIIILPTSVALKADEVGYVPLENYTAANTKIQVKEGNDFLRFTTQSTAPGTWRINRVETTGSLNVWNIRTGSLSSSSLDTATLNFNRFDYPYVSASAVYTIQVYPYALGAGHLYTSSIYTRTQTFTKTVAPPNARSVDLKASSYTINYNRDGFKTTPEGGVDLTATAFNTTGSVWFRWYYIDVDGSEQVWQGPDPETTVGAKEAILNIDASDAAGPGENKTWKVKIWDGDPDGTSPIAAGNKPVRAEGQLTITGVKAGADAYKIVGTNENTSISGDLWTKNLNGTAIRLTTFKGTTELENVTKSIVTNNGYPTPIQPDDYDYLGNLIGNLGYSSASIYSKSNWVTQSISRFTTTPAQAPNLSDWRKWGVSQSAEIVYKIDFENGRQSQFVTQSLSVQYTPPAPYNVYMTNENSAIVNRVSGELEFNNTGTVIKAYRGNTELTHKPSGFSGPQWDAYDEVGYPNQYVVSILSYSSHLALPSPYNTPNAILPGNPAYMPPIVGWTAPETNLTGEIVYQIDCEYVSGSISRPGTTLFKTQSFSVQFEGAVGPGIVMRGEWSDQTDYIGMVETTNNRRDAVIYNAVPGTTSYYAAVSGSGPNTYVNPTTSTFYVGGSPPAGFVLIGDKQPDTELDYWEYLGQEEFFVAAKIAIFEESYVKNTINVGTKNGTGAFANIVIAGGRTDPYIAIGQNATVGTAGIGGSSLNPGGSVIGYERPGIFLGIYEQPIGSGGTTGRFSIVNGAGDRYLKWNGSSLEIAGDITVTGGNAASQAGVSGSIASGSYTSINVAAVQTAVAVNALSGSLGAMAAINSINSGNATTFIGPGVIVANMFAGTAIQSTNYVAGSDPLFAQTGTFINLAGSSVRMQGFAVDSSGNAHFKGALNAATGTYSGSMSVGTGANSITMANGVLSGPGFTLSTSGLSVTNASIAGTINANAGSIGNWTVDSDTGNLRDSTNRIFFDPSLPGLAIKESGTTRLKVNYGALTDLGGSSISLSAESLVYTNSYASSVGVSIDVESTGQNFTVPAGYYVDSSVVFPSAAAVIDSFNRQGYMDLYWGYRIYDGATLVSEVIIASDWWNGGVDETYANFNGYTGTFGFSPPNSASTTYTFKTFFVCQGFQYNTGGSGSGFSVTFSETTPAISATSNINVVELTNDGIQVATSTDRYIKLKRENSSAAAVLESKGFLKIIGDGSTTPIQISGTTGGTAIDIASSTGIINTNNNSITMGTGQLTWKSSNLNNASLTQTTQGGQTFPTVYLQNLYSAGGGTIRGLEVSLSNWTIGRGTSSRRLKYDIQNWTPTNLLDTINNIPVRTFYWKVDEQLENPELQIGMIAEEVVDAGLPHLVDYEWFPKDPTDPDGEKEYLTAGFDKVGLTFVLWKAVQELTKKVKDLENKLGS
jgi:hypothetical protein